MWAGGAFGYLSDYLLWWIALASVTAHTYCFFRFVGSRKRPRRRLLVGNLLVGACLLTLVGTIAETYLRFLVVETDSFGVTLTSKRWFKLYPRQNSLLFRDVEWTPRKPQGVRRIAFVGDSFTYGWGINDERDRFTNLLQGKFDAQRKDAVEVMNVAWVAWGTEKELAGIHDVIREYAVDEVVLCYLPNDIEPLLPVTDEFNPVQPPRTQWINTDGSFLLDFLYHRVAARWRPSVRQYFDWLWDGYENPEIWHKQQKLLGAIINECRDQGVTLHVALLPFLTTWGDKYQQAAVHAKLRAFLELNHVEVVDLLPSIAAQDPKGLIVNAHDPHPNEAAHRLFADVLWKAFYDTTGR